MRNAFRIVTLGAIVMFAASAAAPPAAAHTTVGVDGNDDGDCDDKLEAAEAPAGGVHVCVIFPPAPLP